MSPGRTRNLLNRRVHDAENQGEYRANRDVVEDSAAFIQMKEDALNGEVSATSLQNNTAFIGILQRK